MKVILDRAELEGAIKTLTPAQGMEATAPSSRKPFRNLFRIVASREGGRHEVMLYRYTIKPTEKGQPEGVIVLEPQPQSVRLSRGDVVTAGESVVTFYHVRKIVRETAPEQTIQFERVGDVLAITLARARFRLFSFPPVVNGQLSDSAPVAPVETPAPVAVVSASVAEAFGMKGLPNTVIVPDPAPAKEPAPMPKPTPAPKPAPARVHAPSAKRPPDAPATLSAAAQSILAALGKVGGKGDKRTLIGAGADKAAWSDALSECYRAKVVQRVKGAEVVHALA